MVKATPLVYTDIGGNKLEYNQSYWKSVLEQIKKCSSNTSLYSIEVDPGFQMPPVRKIVSFISDTENEDLQDEIAKYCILGRTVKIKFDGDFVGPGICFNSINDPWDLWSELSSHPLAPITLRESASAFVLKNSIPQRKPGRTEAEVVETQQPVK